MMAERSCCRVPICYYINSESRTVRAEAGRPKPATGGSAPPQSSPPAPVTSTVRALTRAPGSASRPWLRGINLHDRFRTSPMSTSHHHVAQLGRLIGTLTA